MLEFLLLFVFFYWVFSRFDKKRKKRKLFKPSLDQELAELIQAEDNSTGIALSVKQYLLDVLDDDKNDREKYSDARLAQGQLILDKAGSSAFYFMADIATQLSIVASAQINGIPNNVEAELLSKCFAYNSDRYVLTKHIVAVIRTFNPPRSTHF